MQILVAIFAFWLGPVICVSLLVVVKITYFKKKNMSISAHFLVLFLHFLTAQVQVFGGT